PSAPHPMLPIGMGTRRASDSPQPVLFPVPFYCHGLVPGPLAENSRKYGCFAFRGKACQSRKR
ncbi:MAG: hypothetical protein IJ088_02355, partial [Clostridia bacterium]|nr:hypothetical protein [Clostridia bacterium]